MVVVAFVPTRDDDNILLRFWSSGLIGRVYNYRRRRLALAPHYARAEGIGEVESMVKDQNNKDTVINKSESVVKGALICVVRKVYAAGSCGGMMWRKRQ